MKLTAFVPSVKSVVKEITLVFVCAALVIVCLKGVSYLQTQTASRQAARLVMRGPLVTVGSQVSLQSADFDRHVVSLVLVSSQGCRYCLQSASFHKKLLAAAHQVGVPFYVVIPDRSQAVSYLSRIGASQTSVREWKDLSVRTAGTPTIIAVDSNKTAKRVWVGRLPSESEDDLLRLIRTPAILPIGKFVTRGGRVLPNYGSGEDLRHLAVAVNGRVQIIDVHERDDQLPRPDALVMPLMEITARSRFELDQKGLQVVDCSNLNDTYCETAVIRLSTLGFQVATFGAGSFYENCEVEKYAQ